MSIRWRKSGELICGAKSEPMDDDDYLDDRVQYRLSLEVGIITPDEDEHETGLWHWTHTIRPFDMVERAVGEAVGSALRQSGAIVGPPDDCVLDRPDGYKGVVGQLRELREPVAAEATSEDEGPDRERRYVNLPTSPIRGD